MIPSIGIVTSTLQPLRRQMQDALFANGMEPTLPMLAHVASYNLALMWDDGKGEMRWNAAAIAECKRCQSPCIYYYNNYYYNSNPKTLRWTISGQVIAQDDMTLEGMTAVLRRQYAWFKANGLGDAWIMVDEPPHLPRYGWTQEVEDRVVKFVSAAVDAGFAVWLAVNPQMMAFWYERIAPSGWLLVCNDASITRATYMPTIEQTTAHIGLYNRRGTFAGLGQQMREFGASKYLHWSATWKDLPIMDDDGTLTPEAAVLIAEVAPVEDYPDLGSYLIAMGDDRQVMQLNPGASLQRMMFLHGFVPTSPEFDVEYMGEAFVAQRAESLQTGEVRVYYAPTWDYNRVSFTVRPT